MNRNPDGFQKKVEGMKSVLIISAVTFFLIFGGLAVLSNQLDGNPPTEKVARYTPNTTETDLLMKGLNAERALLRREKEELVTLRQSVTVQEQVLEEGRRELMTLAGKGPRCDWPRCMKT